LIAGLIDCGLFDGLFIKGKSKWVRELIQGMGQRERKRGRNKERKEKGYETEEEEEEGKKGTLRWFDQKRGDE